MARVRTLDATQELLYLSFRGYCSHCTLSARPALELCRRLQTCKGYCETAIAVLSSLFSSTRFRVFVGHSCGHKFSLEWMLMKRLQEYVTRNWPLHASAGHKERVGSVGHSEAWDSPLSKVEEAQGHGADADLQRAIERSIADSVRVPDEDDSVQRAIALSLRDNARVAEDPVKVKRAAEIISDSTGATLELAEYAYRVTKVMAECSSECRVKLYRVPYTLRVQKTTRY